LKRGEREKERKRIRVKKGQTYGGRVLFPFYIYLIKRLHPVFYEYVLVLFVFSKSKSQHIICLLEGRVR